MAPTLQKIVSVQDILVTEERQEYLTFTQRQTTPSSPSRTSSSPAVPPPHPLAIMHAEGVYQKALCRLLENGCAPVAADMEQRVRALQEKVIPRSQALSFVILSPSFSHVPVPND